MKKMDDEQIQQLAEHPDNFNNDRLSDEEITEIAAYRLLFENLEQAPPDSLSYQFAAKTAALVRKKINWKNDIRFYAFSLLIFTVGLAGGYGLLYLANAQAGQAFLDILGRFKWMIAMASVIFLIIQFADQKAVKGA